MVKHDGLFCRIRALLRAGKMENKTVDINLPAGGMRMALDNPGGGGPQPIMLHDLIVRVSPSNDKAADVIGLTFESTESFVDLV